VENATGYGSYSEQGQRGTTSVTYPDFVITTKLFGKHKKFSLYELLCDKIKIEVDSKDVKYK
jgi:hypothetical protein